LQGNIAAVLNRARIRPDYLGVWIASVAFALIVAVLAQISRTGTAALMVIAVAALGFLYVRVLGLQVGLVLLLLVTSVIDRFTFRAGPVYLRPEEVAAVGAAVVFVIAKLRAGETSWLRPSMAEVFLGGWLVVSVISSLVESPDRALSVKNVLLLAVVVLGFVLPRRILTGERAAERLDTVVRCLLVVFATEAVYGSFGYLIHVFGPTIAISPNPASGHLGSHGTLWEPNVFGAFVAAGCVAWVYLGPRRFRRAWIGLALCMGGLVDSLTRAAWAAAAFVGGAGVALPRLRRHIDLLMVGTGLLGGLLAAAAVLVVDAIGSYTVPISYRVGPAPKAGFFSAILNLTDFVGRINQVGLVWDDIRGDVLLGRGTATFEFLHHTNGVSDHIASLPLLALNDTGLIGLVLFGAFTIAVIVRAWTRRHHEVVLGLGQMALVIALANLATQTTQLMVDWLLIGLLMAAVDIAPAVPSAAAERQPERRAA
jgi:hypothetical protein